MSIKTGKKYKKSNQCVVHHQNSVKAKFTNIYIIVVFLLKVVLVKKSDFCEEMFVVLQNKLAK